MSDAATEDQTSTLTRFVDRLTGSRGPEALSSEHTKFTEAALERHKREGMALAMKARFIALGVIALMLPFLNFDVETIYYQALLIGFLIIGWAQNRVAKVGRSRAEIVLLLADILLLCFVFLFPNPLDNDGFPEPMYLRFGNFIYFFIFLAFATLAYSWRTVWGMGVFVAVFWMVGLTISWWFAAPQPELTEAAQAFGNPGLAFILDPNNYLWFTRFQEVVVFLLVAGILAVSVRRFGALLIGNAALERERENLARYFSPNVVEELSQNDEPLKSIRTQDIAVLFVDIVGFTTYAAGRPSEEVIQTLRAFHKRMEAEVFRHNGTLDKYLGDGLMATFGTPIAHADDAANALRCARAMIASLAEWNKERVAAGEPEIRAGVGVHYGPAVLGDIGSNRLEFAVIGNTVNVASRVEALTRSLKCGVAATDDLVARAKVEMNGEAEVLDLTCREGQEIRGLDRPITVWTLPDPNLRAA